MLESCNVIEENTKSSKTARIEDLLTYILKSDNEIGVIIGKIYEDYCGFFIGPNEESDPKCEHGTLSKYINNLSYLASSNEQKLIWLHQILEELKIDNKGK